MSKPAFLVDGQMEQKIIQQLCLGSPVRRIGCNGKTATITTIAKFASAQIRALRGYRPIVVVIDRERRMETAEQIETILKAELSRLGHTDGVIVGIASRCIENWILADWDSVCHQEPGMRTLPTYSEDTFGKTKLKQLLPEGFIYSETAMGPKLFGMISPHRAATKSASLSNLLQQIDFPCRWLNQ